MALPLMLTLPLYAHDAWQGWEQSWIDRIRLVLETRPGTLPWRPEFGCDLDSLVGHPATAARISAGRWQIEQALRRWLPELTVARCTISVLRVEPNSLGAAYTIPVPVAEAALLQPGASASLEIGLELETPDGLLSLHAHLHP